MTSKDIDFKRINYLAVLAAAVAAMVIGGIWYRPGVFGAQWMSLAGFTSPPEAGMMVQAYIKGFIVALVVAFCLALLIDWTRGESWRCGAVIAIVCWLGFAATVRADNVIFGGRPLGLFWIDGGYDLVSYIVMGAIIGSWLKKRA
jgi:hypothetical protein